eukprot:TCONS_00053372-protein
MKVGFFFITMKFSFSKAFVFLPIMAYDNITNTFYLYDKFRSIKTSFTTLEEHITRHFTSSTSTHKKYKMSKSSNPSSSRPSSGKHTGSGKPKKRISPLSEPINRGKQSIHYVLTEEEREILFRGMKPKDQGDGLVDLEETVEVEEKNEEEKSALTCILLLMFEELEHQPVVYEKLMGSELFDGCLKKVPEGQTELVRKILKNS